MDWGSFVVSAAAAFAYGALGWRLGDRFPFSRYSMYADVRGRTEGAVLYVRTGGRFVHAARLRDVHGFTASVLDLEGVPCSQEWQVWEARRWIDRQQSAEPHPDAVPIEVGFRHLRVAEGRVVERLEPRGSGSARVA